PTFKVKVDEETSQTLISGMGELHLEIIVDRLLREFKVEANVGKPEVAYRETIRKSAEAEGRFVRQTGGRGQYGDVWLTVAPAPPGAGFVFENKIVGGKIPKEFIPAVEKGVREALTTGVLRRPGDPRPRAARPHVRLRHRCAVHDAGSRDLHDAVLPVRGSAGVRRRGDHGEGGRQTSDARRFPLMPGPAAARGSSPVAWARPVRARREAGPGSLGAGL